MSNIDTKSNFLKGIAAEVCANHNEYVKDFVSAFISDLRGTVETYYRDLLNRSVIPETVYIRVLREKPDSVDFAFDNEATVKIHLNSYAKMYEACHENPRLLNLFNELIEKELIGMEDMPFSIPKDRIHSFEYKATPLADYSCKE